MPDRYGNPVDLDELAGRQLTEAELDTRAVMLANRASSIRDCDLCNDEGYRGCVVCDHVERADVYARGMAAVQAALTKGTRTVTDDRVVKCRHDHQEQDHG